jgi:polyphosphate kinase-like protein
MSDHLVHSARHGARLRTKPGEAEKARVSRDPGELEDQQPDDRHASEHPDAELTAALPEERFLDREESWLRFNQRVLEIARDPELPLLERVRFLAIFAGWLPGSPCRRRAAGSRARCWSASPSSRTT